MLSNSWNCGHHGTVMAVAFVRVQCTQDHDPAIRKIHECISEHLLLPLIVAGSLKLEMKVSFPGCYTRNRKHQTNMDIRFFPLLFLRTPILVASGHLSNQSGQLK